MNFLKTNLLAAILLVTSFTSAQATVEAVIGSVALENNTNLATGLPESANSEILISREQYLISYNKFRRAPNWVAWELDMSRLGKVKRSEKFRIDADLDAYFEQTNENFRAVRDDDFKHSCFDRGHVAPSADRTATKEDNEATFNMSNMTAQTPFLNQVTWEHLERYSRELVINEGKRLYQLAGPIYDADFGSIGPDRDIPVPSKNFKIIFMLDANQSVASIGPDTPYIAVIMPNTLKDGSIQVPYAPGCRDGGSKFGKNELDDWKQYQTTLEEVEQEAGLSFVGVKIKKTTSALPRGPRYRGHGPRVLE